MRNGPINLCKIPGRYVTSLRDLINVYEGYDVKVGLASAVVSTVSTCGFSASSATVGNAGVGSRSYKVSGWKTKHNANVIAASITFVQWSHAKP